MSERAVQLEPLTLSVERLLAKVKSGEVRIPPFQRRFRWKPKQVAELFDSIHRSFPIGTLLFWKRRAVAEHVTLGQLEFDAPAIEAGQWVVDGQQRLISLANVLLVPTPKPPFVVSFELESQRFIAGRSPRQHVPLHVAVDSEKLIEWLTRNPLVPELQRRAIRLGSALREYQLPVWSVSAESEDDIREIFGRLNSRGTPVKPAELFDALESTPAQSLLLVSERLDSAAFGRIALKLVHQTIRAIQGDDFTSDRVGTVKDDAVFDKAERGLRSAIVFLKNTGVPHLSLLPFKFAIVFLGAFFAHHPSPSKRTVELLSRWFWRATVGEQFSGKDLTWLRVVIKAVPTPEDEAVQSLLSMTRSRRTETTWLLSERFDPRHARSRIEALGLLTLHAPVDQALAVKAFESGVTVFRELFPIRSIARQLPRNLRGEETRTLLSIANRALFVEGAWLRSPALSALDQDATSGPGSSTREAAKTRVEGIFAALVKRRDFLETWIPQFLESKMRTLASDRPAIETLILPDEGFDAA
jgi:hypothetical protein